MRRELAPATGVMMLQKPLHFMKMNGLGNDFVIIDGRAGVPSLTADMIAAIADRQHGIGCDQLILLQPAACADIRMRIYNADGGEVTACGNATRCIGDLLMRETGADEVTVATAAGNLRCWRSMPPAFLSHGDAEGWITVDMGPPRLDWQAIPLAHPVEDIDHVAITDPSLAALSTLGPASILSMGNPHAIFWVQALEVFDLAHIGPKLEYNALFPERANISLAHLRADNHVDVRVWERGVGITKACGTAACAAAVAAMRRFDSAREMRITLPGGDLVISWQPDDHVYMRGPVAYESSGHIPTSIVSGYQSA